MPVSVSRVKSDKNYFYVDLGLNDVEDMKQDLFKSFTNYFDFIDSSHKQMVDVILSQFNDDDKPVFKTPRRKTSKRGKRSSVAAKTNSLIKSKYRKLSTVRKSKRLMDAFNDENVDKENVEVMTASTPKTMSNSQPKTVINEVIDCVDNKINSEAVVKLDKNIERNIKTPEGMWKLNESSSGSYTIEKNKPLSPIIDIIDIIPENETKIVNKSALELFSELTLIENENTEVNTEVNIEVNEAHNKLDNEWITDDENDTKDGEFFDAIDKSGVKQKTKRKLNKSLIDSNKKELQSSAVKAKRKKGSQYFTPKQSISRPTTRIQTKTKLTQSKARCEPKLSHSSSIEKADTSIPRTIMTRQMQKIITSSGGSTTSCGSAQKYGSSSRNTRFMSRIKTPDTKELTASAAKRREEADTQRKKRLEASQQKENKAIQNRQLLLEKLANEKKQKALEKEKRTQEFKELQKLKDEEKKKKEYEKREDTERRLKQLEDERRELLRKRHDDMQKRVLEYERKKQLKEQEELVNKMQKQEEMRKRQELDREKALETERLAAMIQQHNNSLQQKAVAQSFLKKDISKTNVLKISPQKSQKVNTFHDQALPSMENKAEIAQTSSMNHTFVINKDEDSKKNASVYEMTPPPKEYNNDNYDISEIKSDDDTDDEKQPRKPIPSWARGANFLAALKQQYGKPSKQRIKESKEIFSAVQLPVDLGVIFVGQKAVSSKYSKRTSSAVWTSPPSKYANISNMSVNSSRSDSSFFKN